MASSSSKGLTIGIVAFAIGAVIFAVGKKMHTPDEAPPATSETAAVSAPATPGTETPATAAETPAATETATTEAPKTEAAATPAEGDKTAPAAAIEKVVAGTETPAEEESLLASPAALDIDIKQALEERVMGDPSAPITMIEYASLTCPHCARFANTILPKIKPTLIDSGKMKLVFRDYPLDTYGMKAAMMARCADPDKYFDLIEVIFRNQERWAKNDDPLEALTQLGSFAGMTKPYINACMKNAELENSILVRVQEGQTKYRLNATPTFIFNNGAETLSGDQNPEDFEAIVNKLTKGK